MPSVPAMNPDLSNSTSTISPSSLRTRRPPSRATEPDRFNLDAKSASTLESVTAPYLRTSSAIPNQNPSRPLPGVPKAQDRPPSNRSLSGPTPGRESQRKPSASTAGFWESSWSSLQGVASNLLKLNDGDHTLDPRQSHTRRRRPFVATHARSVTTSPAQWGPSGTTRTELGKGSQESRLAEFQAKKRENLLAANGHLVLDASGQFKRRDSDERGHASAPPPDHQDREALVYIHHVQPQDTLAGVMIKYSCQANAFRKANRLWPNDNIQIRKAVVLPVDACAIKGRKVPSPAGIVNGSSDIHKQVLNVTQPTAHPPWAGVREAPEILLASTPSSPSISVTGLDETEPPWRHDSWVLIDGFDNAVEIARLSRRALGYFPPSRRKSQSFSDISSPPAASLDLPRRSYQDYSPRRGKSGSSSTSTFPLQLHGPGGVGTLGKDVRGPGPAQDGLNKLFASHLPNVAPRQSFESEHSTTTTGIEAVGGVIEGWVRKVVSRAAASVQVPPSTAGTTCGDLIELQSASEGGRSDTLDSVGSAEMEAHAGPSREEQERMLQEHFPPRGRVFGASPRRMR